MKTGRLLQCLMAFMLFGVSALPMMAQKNIDKVVKALEKRMDVSVNSVTKRDPKTRKIVSMTKTYSLKDTRVANALRQAFEQDEEFALTANKILPKGRANATDMNFHFVFYPQENEKQTYSLTCDRNGIVTLTIMVKQVKGNRDVSDLDFDFFFNDVEMKTKTLFVNQKVKDELGCLISENGNVEMEGDVFYNGKRLGKGRYFIDGHKVIVK